MRPSKKRLPPRYHSLAAHQAPSMFEVRAMPPLISTDSAGRIAALVVSSADALLAGLTLATVSGARLEQKSLENVDAASTLAEIQLEVAQCADRMGAVAALLRVAEMRAQLVLMSTVESREAYALAKNRFFEQPSRR